MFSRDHKLAQADKTFDAIAVALRLAELTAAMGVDIQDTTDLLKDARSQVHAAVKALEATDNTTEALADLRDYHTRVAS